MDSEQGILILSSALLCVVAVLVVIMCWIQARHSSSNTLGVITLAVSFIPLSVAIIAGLFIHDIMAGFY